MSDVLDNERRPTPPWVVPVALVTAVGVIVALAWRTHDSAPSAGRRPVAASPSPSPVPTLPDPVRAANGCGGDVEQPLLDADRVPPGTGLRILVGERDLRLVDVDAGSAQVLTTRTDSRSFAELGGTAGQVLAVLRDPCGVAGYGKGVIAAVDPGSGRLTPLGAGDALLPGEPPAALDVDAAGAMTVRDVGSKTSTPVPPRWSLLARTAGGYFVSVFGSDNVPPEVGVGSTSSARLTATFGRGDVVAASPELLFWLAGDCPGRRCLLTWTTVDGTSTAEAIGSPGWGGVVSPDGLKMAFDKQRPSGRFGGHPGPPGDVAVLDRSHGAVRLTVLRGLVLPAKAGLTLTWSRDSRWLVIGVDLGTGPAVLIWREGMDRPARVPLPPSTGRTTGPPALLVLPSAVPG